VISSKNKTYELTANSKHYDLIIAKEVFIPDYVVVLHNSDYEQLFKESELEYKKILYTLTISRNFDVEEIVNILKSELTEASNKIVSRRELYAITEREIRLSKFLFTFTEILLFIVSGCILYFNLIMEVSEVKTIYFKLYRIGITDDEIIEVIHSQIRIVLFLPCLLASIIGSLYVTLLTLNEPNTPIYTLSTLSTIVIYVLFYFLIYQIVKSKFIKEIIYADQ
jgi:putative ABC transport system permease protein